MHLEPGIRVSHYRLVRRLGAGGMGHVYLAEDLALRRQVAIKFLLGPFDEQARKRLLVEARAAAALDHPGICAVYEIDRDEFAGDFIVMQYVEGETLSARVKRGRLPPGQALRLCARIAEALHAAHIRGIVHRDLKPQNVILTSSDEPKLLDFGVAKRVTTAPRVSDEATESQLTSPQAVVGTPGYMAPEQIRQQLVDQRTDLFALGCVLYECLTAHRAFSGDTSEDIKANVLQRRPPPPSSLVPELGAAHDALVARLLEKDPVLRFQSANEALGAIRALESLSDPSGARITRAGGLAPLRRRPAVMLAATALIVLAGVVVWQAPWIRRLPVAPSDAAGWYARGVEALHEGRFATARSSLDEAVRLFPGYALAYLRLAEAQSELDNSPGANAALVRAAAAIPSETRLTREQDLRMRAVRASVIRDHNAAIAAFRDLTAMHGRDPSSWLDLGRAQDAAGMRSEALLSYETALSLDTQHAAARLRRGVLQVQMANPGEGFHDLDEAIRLYHTAGQQEGKVEALIRKAELLTNSGEYTKARAAVEQAMPLIDSHDAFHQARASFSLARLAAMDGRYSEAEARSRKTVDEAMAAGLYATASQGLTDFGYTLTVRRQYAEAAQVLARAAEVAGNHGARRAEMRAKLQRASLLLATGEYQQAIDASAEPLRFYAEHRFHRSEADGKNIIARAYEGLERYGDAATLSAEVLALADTMKDSALAAVALDNVAGQLASQGRLPEALAYRERLESIHRAQKNQLSLPYALNNRAELLIRLGRGADAEPLLDEVARKSGEGLESFKQALRRTAMLRAMRATVERRWHDVETFAKAAIAMPNPADRPDGTSRWGSVLLEHSLAQRQMSRLPTATIAGWLEATSAPVTRREMTYWVAQTLLARGERERAGAIAAAVVAGRAPATNPELHWRMLALTAVAGNTSRAEGEDATIRHAILELQALRTAWASHAALYLARPDLAALQQRLQ